ncbi:hypothetical protein Tdes44962_MAKER08706 [Teratosphaeria destructans]|uniref:Apple domain-containing protein n=1 Tax=Teratosphaeria destructans TaxID=418781 RepID=A0A9W7SVF1_9PEZI|nr:hypothetical protein Tdes44962_MAKER08706 [Teratosphaeria destructans]
MPSLKHDNSRCAVQPSRNDNPAAFLANTYFSEVATNAKAPEGYVSEFINFKASVSGFDLQALSSDAVSPYLTFTTLPYYDVTSCAKFCDSTKGCKSFNIYFERSPKTPPTDGCTNPPSITTIKCAVYNKPITKASATNVGQYQLDFHVVIAGSNAYNARQR